MYNNYFKLRNKIKKIIIKIEMRVLVLALLVLAVTSKLTYDSFAPNIIE